MSTNEARAVPPNIHQRLLTVARNVGAIPKKYNQKLGYAIHEWDAILGIIRPLMLDAGIMLYEDEVEARVEPKANGANGFHAMICVNFIFVNTDNPEDRFEFNAWGEAADSGDKAKQKATTSALKYAIMRTLMISEHETDEGADADPDTGEIRETDPAEPPRTRRAPVELVRNATNAQRPTAVENTGREYDPNGAPTAKQLEAIEKLRDAMNITPAALETEIKRRYDGNGLKQLQAFEAFDVLNAMNTAKKSGMNFVSATRQFR